MQTLVIKLKGWLNTLAMRERILVTAMASVAIFVIWDTFARMPLDTKTTKLNTEIKNTQTEIKTIQLQLETIEKLRAQDPDAPNKALKAKLSFEIAQLNERLKQLTIGIIEPKKMTRVVEEVLKENKDLVFIGLHNLPGIALSDKSSDTNLLDKEMSTGVFKHGVQLTFSGKYLSTINYLRSLEKLPWRLYWGGLDYQVETYPDAIIMITVYTLSLADGWVGV